MIIEYVFSTNILFIFVHHDFLISLIISIMFLHFSSLWIYHNKENLVIIFTFDTLYLFFILLVNFIVLACAM